MHAVHFIPRKISSAKASRSKWFVQKHGSNDELFHFSNHSELATSHILILPDHRGYQ